MINPSLSLLVSFIVCENDLAPNCKRSISTLYNEIPKNQVVIIKSVYMCLIVLEKHRENGRWRKLFRKSYENHGEIFERNQQVIDL